MALTEEQNKIVSAEGGFLLLACPGSGKTRAAAARLARLVEEGKRVAACSYTNVGVDRIASTLANEHGVFLGPRHLNGTLHRLLLRYVVHPFAGGGHPIRLWMGGWPELAFGGNNRYRVPISCFRRTPDGELVLSNGPRWVTSDERAAEVVADLGERAMEFKTNIFNRHGALTPDDAMSLALAILRRHGDVAEALAARFDELLIDEAQDTNQVHLACVGALKETGRLGSLVMVGDLEQSIYEYQGSTAEGCREFAKEAGLRTEGLNQNHRSSQKLCNVAAYFCDRDPDEAVGRHRDCDIDPEVTLYPEDDPAVAMEAFRARLGVHGISAADAAVLARTWTMAGRLAGEVGSVDVDKRPEKLGKVAAALAAGRLTRGDVDRVEEILLDGAFGDEAQEVALDFDPLLLRRVANAFISELPPLDGSLSDWIVATRDPFTKAIGALSEAPVRKAGNCLRRKADHEQHRVADVFAPPPEDLQPLTVHRLKGEDRDAVMLVVNRPQGDKTKHLDLFETMLGEDELPAEQDPERRVNYVALTRAERYCLLALPDSERGREVLTRCNEIGFKVIE